MMVLKAKEHLMNQKGKVVVITGGSRGIGAAIARGFAKEGAIVVISYTSSPDKAISIIDEIKKMGCKAAAFKADQSDPKQIESFIKQVGREFGQIDVLINNAGIFVPGKVDDKDLDVKGLDKQMAVNVLGVVTTTRAAVHYMHPGSRIILIGSINGERTTGAGYADYSATKAALLGYTHGWARDLGPKNITVNMVQPGPINTDMNPDNTDFAEEIKKSVALGRYGTPEEIAAAVVFLANPGASYITGTTLTVDGGFLA